MEVDLQDTVAETTYNGGARLELMLVLTCFEWSHKNEIAIALVGKYYILVATVCTDREATSIISVEFVDGVETDVDFVGSDFQ